MNVFLFFYLFLLFILLTPGIIINLSIMKSSPYAKFIVAAIHGFLFSAIAITTYSSVNDLYMSWISPATEGLEAINTGYKFTSQDGQKVFNTLSTTPPAPVEGGIAPGPNIKCGKIDHYGRTYKFCGSADPATQKVYCYGSTGGCIWGDDCNTDSDCTSKYSSSSAKYTDAIYSNSYICPNYNSGDWPAVFCRNEKLSTKP
jgi:hypothetical protein